MKTYNYLLLLSLLVSTSLLSQTANFNANGSFKGTPVNSINVDFSTLSASALSFSTSIQELSGIGIVKYKTGTRASYPYTGGSSMVTLLQDNNASGQEGNDISPAYIYLPTMLNGVGIINLSANLPTAAGTTRNIGVQYSVDGGTTWLTKSNATTIAVPSGSSISAPLNFNLNGSVQLRLSFANSTAYLTIKSISVSSSNYTTQGAYIGTPVSTIDYDFSSLSASSLSFSTALQEVNGVGFVKMKTATRTYPYTGGSSMVTLLQDNVNLGQESTDVTPAYIYLPTMSNGIGVITLNANICSASVITKNMMVQYSTDGGNSWLSKAGAEQIVVPSGSTTSSPLEYNLAGSAQLRLSYANGNSWVAIKSIAVSENVATKADNVVEKYNPFLEGNTLHLGVNVVDVYFYSLTGQKLFQALKVSGNIVLPNGSGIVNIISESGNKNLKKIQF